MIRLFFSMWCVTGICFLTLLGIKVGPSVEAGLFPIEINQSITNVERNDHKLCWRWNSEKVRNVSGDWDEGVIQVGSESYVLFVYEKSDMSPWRKSRDVVLGAHHRDLCVDLPQYIKSDVRIILHQTVLYDGWMKLWRLPIPMPDIVSPPDTTPPPPVRN